MPLPVYEKVFSGIEEGFISETHENYAACNHCLRTFPKPVFAHWTGVLTEMNIINIF